MNVFDLKKVGDFVLPRCFERFCLFLLLNFLNQF